MAMKESRWAGHFFWLDKARVGSKISLENPGVEKVS